MLETSTLDEKSSVENVETEQEVTSVKASSSSSSHRYYGDSIDYDTSSWRCFKEIELSSSSLFRHPLYFFPELEDPGIFEAFRYEPPLQIDNDVGRERYIRICKTLEIVPLKRVLKFLDQEELDLRFYGLRPKEFRAIFHVLEMNAYVKKLFLQDSWMDEESVRYLSNMLSQNVTITFLDLKQCALGPTGARALNEGLQLSVTLRELDLSYNSIGDKGIQYLRPTFKSNESIKKINLGHNNLTSVSANILQQFFTFHEVVEDVNLGWNMICSDDAIKKIVTGLRANNRMKSLNLSWNCLKSRKTAKGLSLFIKESTTLEFLDLSNNGFKGSAIRLLKGAIGASVSLKHVRLGNNPLNTEEATALGTMFSQSTTLDILDLENIYFPKAFNPTLKKIKKSGKTLILGGILGNFRIKGPDIRKVLVKRCHYLGLAPKKAKKKRDFGQIVLTLPQEPMDKAEFEEFVRKKKKAKMYDTDLLAEIRKVFAVGKTKVDTQFLLSEYMKMYPDTALPPPKPKKPKKGKAKAVKKAVKISSGTEITTDIESNATDIKVSSASTEKTPGLSSVSSKTGSMKENDSLKEKRSTHSAGSGLQADSKVEEVEVQIGAPIDIKPDSHATTEGQIEFKSLEEVEPDKASEKTKSTVRIKETVDVFEQP